MGGRWGRAAAVGGPVTGGRKAYSTFQSPLTTFSITPVSFV